MTKVKKAAFALSLISLSHLAFAAAPVSSVENPGFYHFNLGSYQVTALSDGVSRLPAEELLLNESADKIRATLKKMHDDNPVTTSINAYLVNTGKKLILFDTGSGSLMGPSLGKAIASIKKAGYTPDQIDDIYLTHLHPDHIGGLVSENNPVFPNATLWVEKKEADYWLNPENEAKATETERPFFAQAREALKPYIDQGRVKMFTQPTLSNGVTVLNSDGHTPGHVFYKIESDNKSLFIVGDLLHVGDIQMANPNVAIKFDTDPKEATQTRLRYFQQFAKEGDAIAAAHLPFPGVGYVWKAQNGYRWQPLTYGADVQ